MATANELLLRFRCPSCHRSINVPLRMAGANAKCPGCSQPLSIPTVDNSLIGFDKVADCVARSTPPPLKPDQGATADRTSSTAGNDHSPHDQLSRSPFAGSQSTDANSDTKPGFEPVEPATPNSVSASIPSSSRINPRLLRLCCFNGIWYGPILFLFAILILDGAPAIAYFLVGPILALPWYIAGGYVAAWITPLVLAATVRTIRCPGCHEQISAVNHWFCSCGYHDHRERNLFLFRCPQCRKQIGRTDCPQCDSTILL